MEIVFRICLFIVGIINIMPSILTFFPNKFKSSYGIDIPNPNFELLLRHRAVLFGIVGGIMIYAALFKSNYNLATIIGLISMVSFVILFYLSNGTINAELNKVLKIDIFGIVILLVGFLLYKLNYS